MCLSRGNFEATLRGAIERLEHIQAHRCLTTLAADMRNGTPETRADVSRPGGSDDAGAMALVEQSALEAARKVKHFAAPKHLAAPLTAGARPAAS